MIVSPAASRICDAASAAENDVLAQWRHGEIETADETPMAIKTCAVLYSRLEATIRARHPYELPEIVAVPISDGFAAYLDWMTGETADEQA